MAITSQPQAPWGWWDSKWLSSSTTLSYFEETNYFRTHILGPILCSLGSQTPNYMNEVTLVSQTMPGEIKVPHLGGGPSRGSDRHFEGNDCGRLKIFYKLKMIAENIFAFVGPHF